MRYNSYNSIDGFPVVSDHEILTDVLRGTYKMPGCKCFMTEIMQRYGASQCKERRSEYCKGGQSRR